MLKRHQPTLLAVLLPAVISASLILPKALGRPVGFVRATQEETIRVRTNLIPVAATVVDGQGRTVDDLRLEDFELRVDGERKQISQLVRSETPVRMAVLFDNSGSLNKNRRFARKAAVEFLQSVLRPKDLAALYAVSSDVELSQPLTNDIAQLVRAVGKIGWPSGGTALLDGINQAAAYLRPRQGRRVIVIISDGADTRSVTPFNDALRAVQAANCQVYAVRTGHSDLPILRDPTGEHRLRELTAQTGGTLFSPTGPADLEAAFRSIAADLAAQYVVSYYAPEDENEQARFHPIELRVPTKPEARIRFRKGYYTAGKMDN